MAIFNSYVKLPEGTIDKRLYAAVSQTPHGAEASSLGYPP